MSSDCELLHEYAAHGNEAAFAEVVRRHVDMVYASAVRLLNGNAVLAEDVAQAVFTDMARKAASLSKHATVAGWLHTSVRYAASMAVRDEQCRRKHEQEASAMTNQTTSTDISWMQLRPLIDEAVGQLREAERNAVILRFFEDKSHREVGAALGLSEDAARMRLERAMEKMRRYFAQRGVTASAALLVSTLGAQAASAPAPTTFTSVVAGKALAGVGSSGGLVAGSAWKTFFSSKGFMGATAVLLVAGAIYTFYLMNIAAPPNTKASAPLANNSSNQKIFPTTNPPTSQPPKDMNATQIVRASLVAATVLTSPVAPAAEVPADTTPPPAIIAPPVALPPKPTAEAAASAASPTTGTSALVLANNRFALDYYRQTNPGPADNAFFSPYSISTALAMTWAGARGDTAAQMAQVLHFSELSDKEVLASFGPLQQAIVNAEATSGAQLTIANSLWPEQNPEHPFLPDYMNLVQNSFASIVTPVDFKTHTENARQQINAWVEGKTNDKIQNLLQEGDVDPFTRLVLVNAIYFKAAWASPFRARANLNDQFHLADGSTKPVVLMHEAFLANPAFARYGDFPDAAVPFQMLSLNYYGDKDAANATDASGRAAGGRGYRTGPVQTGGDLSFVVLLPRAVDGLGALEKSLTAEQLTACFSQLKSVRVQVYLPKFKLDQRNSLANSLKSMGVTNAFIDPLKDAANPAGADFSGMDGIRDLYITKVIHQAFLDVDENGTEAAAATAVMMGAGGAPSPDSFAMFRADHPFLFMIRENTTGSILFLGRLANP